jgi:hypothetical protein
MSTSKKEMTKTKVKTVECRMDGTQNKDKRQKQQCIPDAASSKRRRQFVEALRFGGLSKRNDGVHYKAPYAR